MVLETLRRVYPELTPAQQALADYVARSYQEVAFMTAARLAEALGVNEATVIRFAQRLGYEGYPEMQEVIQTTVLRELRGGPEPTVEASTCSELFRASLTRTSERIKSLSSLIPSDTVERAVAMLLATHEVLIIGAGDGLTLGYHAANRIQALGLRAQLVTTDAASLARALVAVPPGSVVIGCGEANGSLMLRAALDAASASGARTLAFSHSPLAPEAQTADVTIALPPADVDREADLVTLFDALAQTLEDLLPDTQERVQATLAMREKLEQISGQQKPSREEDD